MNTRWCAAIAFVATWGMASAAGAQGPQLARVMREKLQHSQKILEAVVTSDWNGLETHSTALERLTASPGWTPLRYPEYGKYSATFVAALQDLRRVSGDRDSGKATEAYTTVVRRCVECHRYVARARIARLGGS
jgi:hypothetical protein